MLGSSSYPSSALLRDDDKGFIPHPDQLMDVDTSSVVCITLTRYTLCVASMIFEQKQMS